jgi:Ser/Thr protein kinase RdoA (MazF antagonist)
MPPNQDFFEEVATRALAAYSLDDPQATFIRHSDNVTFKIETPGSTTYLLRIHVPVTTAMGAHGADVEAVTSELVWLEALCEDTDLVLQKPVRNRAGALVTEIPYNGSDTTLNCTLLHWLDGQPYHRDLESEYTAHQIGTLLSKLHLHASVSQIPRHLKRPVRDAAYFESVLGGLRPALEDGRIGSADYAVYEESVGLLTNLMRSLPKSRQTHGILHADTHKGNMLYHDGEIRMIDFSFCAFGYYMFDLGICFSDMKESLHSVCLAGYQSLRKLPKGYQRQIEGFFVGSMVGTFCFWLSNPRAQELLARKVPQIARDYAAKFNRGEFFWFD